MALRGTITRGVSSQSTSRPCSHASLMRPSSSSCTSSTAHVQLVDGSRLANQRAAPQALPATSPLDLAPKAGSAPAAPSRRQALLAGLATSAALLLVPEAANAETRGVSKYVKKKRLDPLDTYVPLVLEAREQLQSTGQVMLEDVASARQMLRGGAFGGLRENVRVLGEYAVINERQKEAAPLVNGFFRSLEAFDQVLGVVIREGKALDVEAAKAKLALAVQALDALLATVPEDILDKSRRVLEVGRAKQRAVEQEQQEAAAEQLEAELQVTPSPVASTAPASEVEQAPVAAAAD